MKKPVDPATGAPTFTLITDLATGKVVRVEATLTDGSRRTLYPLTPEQIEAMEEFLEQPRPATH